MDSFDGYLSCANCAKSLLAGYHPIRMSGDRIQFVCGEECGRKWVTRVGEVHPCHQCHEECPLTEHPCIEWEDKDAMHFCKDDCVFDYMIENDITYANPEVQPDVDEE